MEDITVIGGKAEEGELSANLGPVKIKVCPVQDPDVGIIFAMGGEVSSGTHGSVKGFVIRLKKGTERIIEFYLNNIHSPRLEFHPTEPVWITDKDECPEIASWVPGFRWKLQSPHHLRLKNPGGQGDYTYTLRFVDGGQSYECDPIIKNIA
jgi:hypothetical protein